jgi:uroporphyrinogen-III synthase
LNNAMATMQLLVTRPQPQSDAWVRELRAHGLPAHALPLLQIERVGDAAAHEAWSHIDRHGLAVFVSPNAVQAFFALRPAAAAWPPATLAGSTGPGTSDALRDAGVPTAQIVEPPRAPAQFDSEALWQRLRERAWSQVPVLVVRGDGGREWLAEQLRDAGAQVDFVRVYRRVLPTWSVEQQALAAQALAAPQHTVWLLSSSQAAAHLRSLLPQAVWHAARAWATHDRIAEAARAIGFGSVDTVAPTQQAVVSAWSRSIQFNNLAPSDQRP